jgi:hypothetical protein
MITMLYFAMG